MSPTCTGAKAGPRFPFRRDHGADAPVVGVILMVALVIVISAGAFITFKIIGGDPEPTPAVGFRVEDGADRLVVVSTDSNADWSRLSMAVERHEGAATAIYMGAADPYMGDAASASGGDVLAGAVAVSSQSALMRATEFVEFCADVTTPNVNIVVFDHVSNARIGTWSFPNIQAC